MIQSAMVLSGRFYVLCFIEVLFLGFGIYCYRKKNENYYMMWACFMLGLQCSMLGASLMEWKLGDTLLSAVYGGIFIFNILPVVLLLIYAKLNKPVELDAESQSPEVVLNIDGREYRRQEIARILIANMSDQRLQPPAQLDLPPSYSECCLPKKNDGSADAYMETPPPKYETVAFS